MTKNELIDYLKKLQQKNGSFLAFISDDLNDFSKAEKQSSVVITAQVLDILNQIDDEALFEIKKNAFNYILSQRNSDWIFNILGNGFKNKILFPSDLFTTFLALSALFSFDKEILSGKMIAKFLKTLTDAEFSEGGPYFSFVKKHSKDLDLGVNLLIAKFLQMQEVYLPKLNEFIIEKINSQNFSSQFYVFELNKIFDFSDFPQKIDFVKIDFTNFEFNKKDVFFKYINPKNKIIKYIASDVLQSVFYLKEKYDNNYLNTKLKIIDEQEEKIYKLILLNVNKSFDLLGEELKKQAKKMLEKILDSDKNKQISLLSFFFKKSLGDDGQKISDDVVINLGIANIFVWMAYTIYDDFLDDEGDVLMLSVANFCLREFVCLYKETMKDNKKFSFIFKKVMNDLDSANAWELTFCRTLVAESIFYIPSELPEYEDFSKLAQRSLAHGLGPVLMLCLLDKEEKEIIDLLDFFKYYLIARQLNDDAHDWEIDLKKGHINGVLAKILEKFIYQNQIKIIDLDKDLEKLQKDFWFAMVIDISKIVLYNIEKAKMSLEKISSVEKKSLLEQFLQTTENAALLAIKEHKQAMDFLENYKC